MPPEPDNRLTKPKRQNLLRIWRAYSGLWFSRWWKHVRPNARENMLGGIAGVIGVLLGWRFGFISLSKLWVALICGAAGYGVIFLAYSIYHAIFTAPRIHNEQKEQIEQLQSAYADETKRAELHTAEANQLAREKVSLEERVRAAEGELEPKKRELADLHVAYSQRVESETKATNDLNILRERAVAAENELETIKRDLTDRSADIAKLKDELESHHRPRIYAEVGDSGDAMFPRTPIILHNRGSSVAHNVQIHEVNIHHHLVTFSTVPTIAVGASEQTLPTIGDANTTGRHFLYGVMKEEWESDGKDEHGHIKTEHSISLAISYEDFNGQRFETTSEVVFFPVNYINHKTHRAAKADNWLMREFKITEVRNEKFRKVSC